MRRTAVAALAATFLAGLVAVAVAAAGAERPERFTLGMYPAVLLAPLNNGDRVCQTPIALPEPIRAVTIVLGPAGEVRGPHLVTVREPYRGRGATSGTLAQGTIPRGVVSGGDVTVELDRTVRPGRYVAVCVEQRGAETSELWGDTDPARTPATSGAVGTDGRAIGGDVYLRFPDGEDSSLLARIPAAFEHAAPYKLGGMGAWAFWILLAGIVAGGPLLLGRAVARAAADDDG